jgi:phenylacetic acid degradation operon negative regulatory protein
MQQTTDPATKPDTISARTLVLDLLATDEGGSHATADLAHAAAAFGIGAVGMRTAITRLRAEGRIRQVGRGRYAAAAAEPLQRRLRDWRHVRRLVGAWSGAWLLAVPAAAERAHRPAWRGTLRALDQAGFAEGEPGLWVRPDNLRGGAPAARARLADFGGAETLLLVSATQLDAARDARFRRLWDPHALAATLGAHAATLSAHAASVATLAPARAAAETLLHGRAAIRAIVRDPLLPAELCAPDALDRLVAAMTDYDRVGRRAWRTYLARV